MNSTTFYTSCLKNELYVKLTPIPQWLAKREEREELLLRFFAFSEWYPTFSDSMGISKQLDNYMKEKMQVLMIA